MRVRITQREHWGGHVRVWEAENVEDAILRFEKSWVHSFGIQGVLGYTIDEQIEMDRLTLLEECAADDMQDSSVEFVTEC